MILFRFNTHKSNIKKMKNHTYIKAAGIAICVSGMFACTKLDQKLNSSFVKDQFAAALGPGGTQSLLNKAYVDVGGPYTNYGDIFALEEVTTDECLVPTRAGDWDDNGKWRALHQQTFTADAVDIVLNEFTNLNTLSFDATNVLSFAPTPTQAAQARFLRALALYQQLDLFGQFPFRNAGDDLLTAAKVYTGEPAVQFIISELTTIMPTLPASNTVSVASQDAAKVLLMKLYLNHGAFVNRANPTFSDADMQQVITLGNSLMVSGRYKYMTNYFDNFNSTNAGATESIFAYPNTSGVTINNSNPSNRWYPTLHYNSFAAFAPAAGWNGFSTVADFYSSFSTTGTTKMSIADSVVDPRIGERFYKGATDVSGMRPGMLIGQQYDAAGNKLFDRKGNPLAFQPGIASNLKETGSNLEITGIRVLKYPPDFSGTGHSNYANSSVGGNWVIIFRYPDVVLMVAEAKMRAASADNAGALALVNQLRTARGASLLPSMPLVNTANVYDPTTLLAERGRELYWESVRRTDLIRFGMFSKPFDYKTSVTDAHYMLFPIPSSAVSANPNLKQNPGF